MTTQLWLTAFAIALTLAGFTYAWISYKKKKDNRAIPYICFGEKIFLKPSEIEQFERATRQERRRALTKYKARIARGQIIPVYKKGEIIGYVPNIK